MTHIIIKDVCLSLPHKVCFESFSTRVLSGSRIGIVGINGSGKSTLLKMIAGEVSPVDGVIQMCSARRIGYVPQLLDELDSLSGGQRFNAVLTKALAENPDVLLLDEPTNHLDQRNRKSLMRLIRSYKGTVIVVTHDIELLRSTIDTIWHIDQGRIHIFTGDYDDYMREKDLKRNATEQELRKLSQQKKAVHESLMKEQARAKGSAARGEKSIKQRKWPTVVSGAKARRAEETSGAKKSAMRVERMDLVDKLAELRVAEIIKPTFSLAADDKGVRTLVKITDGSVGYSAQPIVSGIHLAIFSGERIVLTGDNGSGKSTLIKGILSDSSIFRFGDWYTPKTEEIGYLDQSYGTLDRGKTVFETIKDCVPSWEHVDIRKHLNAYLFRKNEEISACVENLSGGERARLSLAQIGAKTPKLLILDEITNNLDLYARKHVIDVLRAFPGAMIIVSHDMDFLNEIGSATFYRVFQGAVVLEQFP